MFLPRPLFFTLLLLSACWSGASTPEEGQAEKKAKPAQGQDLSQLLRSLQQDPDLEHASFGILAINLQTGDTVLSHNARKSLTPASSLKLLTTAGALLTLGPDHTFRTILRYRGTIRDKVLHGDLIIKGMGDPALLSRYFPDHYKALWQKWAAQVQKAGIDSVTGDIIGDGSYFASTPLTPRHWIWEDIGNYYGAAPNGLCVLDNAFEVTLSSPGTPGKPTTLLHTTPSVPGLTLENHVKASRDPRDQAYVFGAPGTDHYYINGTIPAGREAFTIRGAIPNPPLLAAHEFRKVLMKNGISVKGQALSPLPEGNAPSEKEKTIATQHSPSVSEIVHMTNWKSMNLFAEHLLLHAARKNGTVSSSEEAAQAMKRAWKERGMKTNGLFLSDGSGLSRADGITPAQMMHVLRTMDTSQHREIFLSSLPVAGKNGSLSYMMQGTLAEGVLRAKSGYMERVRSYAGYTENVQGERVAFVLMANNYSCSATEMRKKWETVMVALTKN